MADNAAAKEVTWPPPAAPPYPHAVPWHAVARGQCVFTRQRPVPWPRRGAGPLSSLCVPQARCPLARCGQGRQGTVHCHTATPCPLVTASLRHTHTDLTEAARPLPPAPLFPHAVARGQGAAVWQPDDRGTHTDLTEAARPPSGPARPFSSTREGKDLRIRFHHLVSAEGRTR